VDTTSFRAGLSRSKCSRTSLAYFNSLLTFCCRFTKQPGVALCRLSCADGCTAAMGSGWVTGSAGLSLCPQGLLGPFASNGGFSIGLSVGGSDESLLLLRSDADPVSILSRARKASRLADPMIRLGTPMRAGSCHGRTVTSPLHGEESIRMDRNPNWLRTPSKKPTKSHGKSLDTWTAGMTPSITMDTTRDGC
jgi:hypothetical protein